MGNTLRGLLLYGYAFATIGTIAGIAAIVSFGLAAPSWCSPDSDSGTPVGRSRLPSALCPQVPCLSLSESGLISRDPARAPGRSVCAERHRGRGDMSVRRRLVFAALVAALLVSA